MMKYKVIDRKFGSFHTVQIDSGEFAGCQLTYSKVQIQAPEEEDGEATLIFDYTIVNDYNISSEQEIMFKQQAGDILVDVMMKAFDSDEVIYKGGTA